MLQRRTVRWQCFAVTKNKCINRQNNQASAAAAKFHQSTRNASPKQTSNAVKSCGVRGAPATPCMIAQRINVPGIRPQCIYPNRLAYCSVQPKRRRRSGCVMIDSHIFHDVVPRPAICWTVSTPHVPTPCFCALCPPPTLSGRHAGMDRCWRLPYIFSCLGHSS